MRRGWERERDGGREKVSESDLLAKGKHLRSLAHRQVQLPTESIHLRVRGRDDSALCACGREGDTR